MRKFDFRPKHQNNFQFFCTQVYGWWTKDYYIHYISEITRAKSYKMSKNTVDVGKDDNHENEL